MGGSPYQVLFLTRSVMGYYNVEHRTDMDGVPGVTQYPIPPGGNFTYRFSVKNEYGSLYS